MNSQASTSKTTATARHQTRRCRAGSLAILSTRHDTRIVRVKARAADLYYDWKVEVLGSPVWCVDARSDAPAFTNLGFVMDAQLIPLAETDDVDLAIA